MEEVIYYYYLLNCLRWGWNNTGILANQCAGRQQPRLSKAIAAPPSRDDWNHRRANH